MAVEGKRGGEALLVIDMLNDFILEGAPLEVPAARKIVPAIREESERFRKEGKLVVYVCDQHRSDDSQFVLLGWPPHAIAGSDGARIVEELTPAPQDIVVPKTTYSGFYRTDLDDILRRHKITDLVISGCVTHICVLFTASDAVLRGYRVKVPQRAVAGLDESDHEAALRLMKNVLGVKIV